MKNKYSIALIILIVIGFIIYLFQDSFLNEVESFKKFSGKREVERVIQKLKQMRYRVNDHEKAYIWYWWKYKNNKNKIPYNTLIESLLYFKKWNIMINFEDNITCDRYSILKTIGDLQNTVNNWLSKIDKHLQVNVNVVAIRYKPSIKSKIGDLKQFIQQYPGVPILEVSDNAPNFSEESLWKNCCFYKGAHIQNRRDRYRSPRELENCGAFYHTLISVAGTAHAGAHATPHYMRFFEGRRISQSHLPPEHQDKCLDSKDFACCVNKWGVPQQSIKNQKIMFHEFGHCIGLTDIWNDNEFPRSINIKLSDPLYTSQYKRRWWPYNRFFRFMRPRQRHIKARKIKTKSIMYQDTNVKPMDLMMLYKILNNK